MQTTIPLYGFGGGSGAGATLTVTAPVGATVTVSKDGKIKTKVAGVDGVAVFRGLATGTWTVTITDGVQTAQKTVTITADYSTAITFFAATIHVTYPAGSTCTATDGVTTLTAPDTSGTWGCVVPNAGTWTFTLDNGLFETVTISENGESIDVDTWYLYKRGKEYDRGLTKDGYVLDALTSGDPDKNTDSMYFQAGVGLYIVAGTNEKISLSGFSSIKVVCNVTGVAWYQGIAYGLNLDVTAAKNLRQFAASKAYNIVQAYDDIVPVPDDHGDYYISFRSNTETSIHGYLYELGLKM